MRNRSRLTLKFVLVMVASTSIAHAGSTVFHDLSDWQNANPVGYTTINWDDVSGLGEAQSTVILGGRYRGLVGSPTLSVDSNSTLLVGNPNFPCGGCFDEPFWGTSGNAVSGQNVLALDSPFSNPAGAIGREVRLVTADQPWKVNFPHPDFVKIHETEKSRFYPASPVSISNVASLDALNDRLQAPVPMNRFRMNIVIEGLDAWDEERIDTIGSDSMELEGLPPAERCIIVTTDQETGERKKSDVLRELSKFHRKPKGQRFGSGLSFGQYLAVSKEGPVKVGDRLKVSFKD